ncbi:hypothetical protein JM946_10805 [Steroidobacter sp. S1-65]|uniref:Lipoprotein n=1 Tax=Steroidobacter gossypii TaxID=2805490 RepID=A0ABS1WWB4_9GAMM|nr:hypothetical protein [Steroidobacter gossypii]MBM0105242.1 hypothetical protein [Steroidobacter gossypii]
MRRLLAGIVQVFATLLVSACNWSPTPRTPNAAVEAMPELGGDPPVSVRSFKVLAGTPSPMSRADALAGLKDALPYLQQAAKQSELEGKTPTGSFVNTFVALPDGTVPIMMEGQSRLNGGDPNGVVKGFLELAMSNEWRFPASGGKTLIEVEFVVGRP